MSRLPILILAGLLSALPAAARADTAGDLRPAPHRLLVVDGGAALAPGWLAEAYGDLDHVTLDLADPASDPTGRFAGASAVVVELSRAAYPEPAVAEGKARKRGKCKRDPQADRARVEATVAPRMTPLLDAAATAAVPVLWMLPPPAPPVADPGRGKKRRKCEPPVDWLPGVVEAVCAGHAACDPLDATGAGPLLGWLEARLDFAPPPPPDLWDDEGFLHQLAASVTVDDLRHPSEARAKEVGYMVFAPVVDDPDARFPVLYLLHGAYDGYTAWPDHARDELEAFVAELGLIVVTPDGDPFGWYVDSPVDPHSQIERYLFEELMPAVEGAYPVMEGRRAIAGLSMGGHGALSLALRHPGHFQSASSMSGVLDLTRHERNSPELADRLGPLDDDPAFWEGLSVTHLLASRGAGDLRFRFTCGEQDRKFIDENRELHELLEELGIDHEYDDTPGRHSWDYWTGQLESHLRFHAEYLSGDGVR